MCVYLPPVCSLPTPPHNLLTIPNPLVPAAASSAAHEDDAEEMCPACMSDVPRWKLLSAGCGHDMCTDCWRGHLTARLAEFGKDVHFLGGCPDPGCGAIIPESVWLEMANDHDRTVYTQHVIHSYIPLTGQVRALRLPLGRSVACCCLAPICWGVCNSPWLSISQSSSCVQASIFCARMLLRVPPRPCRWCGAPTPSARAPCATATRTQT